MTAEEIVRKLTKAQREAIISARESLFGNDYIIPLRNRWTTKTVKNLQALGLAERHLVNSVRLTRDPGLTVRDLLLENTHD
jgi:hypothetical protein